MNSLEWRMKKLEYRILGKTSNSVTIAHLDRIIGDQYETQSIIDILNLVAKQYVNFIENHGKNYPKFVELYTKFRSLLNNIETTTGGETDETYKAELVLAYEEDLIKYMQELKEVTEKADHVLNIDKWPDLNGYDERLSKLQTITRDQHLKSTSLDKKTEELIEIYNDIISSFKGNMKDWNERLESFGNDKKTLDENE